MRPFLLVTGLAALAACGTRREAEPQANSAEELENRIATLSQGKAEEVVPPPRMGALQRSDLGPELEAEPACRLHREGRLLLVVNAAGAVARIDGRRTPLAVSGAVGPTGGFFTAPGVTVSIGRSAPVTPAAEADVPGWPASATIGGDTKRDIEKVDATWVCTGR
jgi:hypothetical protein